MQQPNRNYTSKSYRYGFQGQEKDDELKGEGNSVSYKYRMHDPRVGRFFAVDPLSAKYPYYSSYQFSGNRLIDMVELEGLEPSKRIKKADSFEGIPYSMGSDNLGSKRTDTGSAGLEKIDCSELVCRVLADDGWTVGIKSMNTALLKEFFAKETWLKSNQPKKGDFFLWRTSKGGHTGVVTNVKGDKVTITHAKGKKWGTITGDVKKLSYFTNMNGWVGFFRPKNDKSDVKKKDLKGLKEKLGFYETLLNSYERIQKMNSILSDQDSKTKVGLKIKSLQTKIDLINKELGTDEKSKGKNDTEKAETEKKEADSN